MTGELEIKSETFTSKKVFFESGITRFYQFRLAQLKALKAAIKVYENEILEALIADMNKPLIEGFGAEVGFLYAELNFAIKNLKKWMKMEKVSTPLVHFPSSSYIIKEPIGVVLIIGPWNYPLHLILSPLIGVIAAGNCAVIKPSEEAVHTSILVEKLINATFESNYISVVQGEGATVVPHLLAEFNFNHIFFTGSERIGKIIAIEAAKKLIPVTLELGGKSPVIVDEDVNIDIAAKRIVWSKFYNAGQTCVSPDYLLLPETIHDEFLERMKYYVREFYGEHDIDKNNLASIINKKRFDTLCEYLTMGEIVIGGQIDEQNLYISPTIMINIAPGSKILREEIFGPIFPVLKYKNIDHAKEIIDRNPYPLSLYLYTNDKKNEQKIIKSIQFGGGCINIGLIHLLNPELPFGGIGNSGMGRYNGKFGFDTFSHFKAITKTSLQFDFPFRYPKYNTLKLKLAKLFLK